LAKRIWSAVRSHSLIPIHDECVAPPAAQVTQTGHGLPPQIVPSDQACAAPPHDCARRVAVTLLTRNAVLPRAKVLGPSRSCRRCSPNRSLRLRAFPAPRSSPIVEHGVARPVHPPRIEGRVVFDVAHAFPRPAGQHNIGRAPVWTIIAAVDHRLQTAAAAAIQLASPEHRWGKSGRRSAGPPSPRRGVSTVGITLSEHNILHARRVELCCAPGVARMTTLHSVFHRDVPERRAEKTSRRGVRTGATMAALRHDKTSNSDRVRTGRKQAGGTGSRLVKLCLQSGENAMRQPNVRRRPARPPRNDRPDRARVIEKHDLVTAYRKICPETGGALPRLHNATASCGKPAPRASRCAFFPHAGAEAASVTGMVGRFIRVQAKRCDDVGANVFFAAPFHGEEMCEQPHNTHFLRPP